MTFAESQSFRSVQHLGHATQLTRARRRHWELLARPGPLPQDREAVLRASYERQRLGRTWPNRLK